MRLPHLHDYQRSAVDFALRVRRCCLFMGLGLGKTVVALTTAAIELYTGNIERILIIAPLRVANTVWHVEAAEWSHLASLRFAIATGTAAERRAALLSDADVHVINVDNVDWLIKNFPRKRWRWDCVIVDESSKFKNPSAKRVKQLRSATANKILTKAGKRYLRRSPVTRLMLLSATPATNGLEGLWAQLSLIDNGRRLGRSFRAFAMTYFTTPPGSSRHARLLPLAGAKERIYERCGDVCYVMRTEDYIELPPITYNDIMVDLPPRARKQYKALEREFYLELERGKDPIVNMTSNRWGKDLQPEEEIVATNEAALSSKLLQFVNGAVYTGETPDKPTPDRSYGIVHDAKLDALDDIVDAAAGNENLLIAYYFKSDLQRLQRAYPQAVVMDKAGRAVAPFNAGKIPLLLAHPESAGMGLNLQRGASTLVFFSLLWSLEAYQQFIGRLYRQGQMNGVTVHHIMCRDTIEQKVASTLRSNARTQQAFIDALCQSPEKRAA